jgi:hypothetical protein
MIAPPGASTVAVLSHEFWVTRFGADPAILNQTLNVNNHLLTVIGVPPAAFHGVAVGESPALFVPVTMESQMLPGRSELEERRRPKANNPRKLLATFLESPPVIDSRREWHLVAAFDVSGPFYFS